MLPAALHGVAALDLSDDVGEIPVERSARADSAVADRREAEVDDRKQVGGYAGGPAEALPNALSSTCREERRGVGGPAEQTAGAATQRASWRAGGVHGVAVVGDYPSGAPR